MSKLTLREHLELLLPLHAEVADICCWCRTKWPCFHSRALGAALKLLDEDYATFRTVLEEIVANERYLAAHEMAAICQSALDRLGGEMPA